jgi:hypothetical protein
MNDPRAIAARLLEDDEPEDPKDFIARHAEADPSFLAQKAEHIHGYVNAWEYGGAWLLPIAGSNNKEIVYIRGLEGEDIHEKSSYDIGITNGVTRDIIRRHGGDPDLPVDEQEDAREIENAIDAWAQKTAEDHNEAIKMPVYRWTVEPLDDWVDAAAVKHDIDADDEQWDSLGLAGQGIAAAEYHGLENFDGYPTNYTRAELSKYLGVKV